MFIYSLHVLGMNGYVSKPVRKDELEASIHTYTQIVVKEMHMFESDDSDSDGENRASSCRRPDNLDTSQMPGRPSMHFLTKTVVIEATHPSIFLSRLIMFVRYVTGRHQPGIPIPDAA